MKAAHALRALRAVAGRELQSFARQPGRLLSALVRPLLWLLVFAAGFQNVFGVAIAPPYDTYIEYRVYLLPGLLGMVALFNGMQSSLAMVYDREMGVMRLLLTAPLPRWWILLAKLVATAVLSLAQAAARKASICANDSTAPPSSLQARIHQRGKGAVSSRRITPISRSYTMASELCMPLNSATIPSRPGTRYTRYSM